jgi:hypothetical protein
LAIGGGENGVPGTLKNNPSDFEAENLIIDT